MLSILIAFKFLDPQVVQVDMIFIDDSQVPSYHCFELGGHWSLALPPAISGMWNNDPDSRRAAACSHIISSGFASAGHIAPDSACNYWSCVFPGLSRHLSILERLPQNSRLKTKKAGEQGQRGTGKAGI